MSASLNWIAWNELIGLPNCLRSRGVGGRVVGRALRDPERLRGRRPSRETVERPHRHLEALVDLADAVRVGHPDQSKIGWPVGEPRIPSLCSSLPTLNPGRSASTTNAVIPREWPASRSVTANTSRSRRPEVGDPVLGPVDHPLVAVADRARDHPARVGSRLGLGQRERRRPLAGGAPGQEPVLQLVGAEQLDRQRPELLDHQDQRGRRARLGDLLDRHVQHQRAGAGAAVLGLERQPEDVLLGQQRAQVPRVLGVLVDLRRARRDPLPRDLPDRVPEVEVLLRDRVEIRERRHAA